MSEAAELQTEVLETGETGAELAPAETHEGFIKTEDAQKDINKQHRKYRDEERARKSSEAEAETLRKELEGLKAAQVDTSVPPVPDPYSSTYEQDVATRDEALQRRTQHEAEQASIATAQTRNVEQSKVAEQEAMTAKIQSFDSNMVAIGLNPAEVKQAADTLVDYGISEQLEDIILEHDEGPLLAKYLAANPIELEALGSMSTLQLVNHITTNVQPKASLLRPQNSNAPAPPITLSGGGVSEIEDPLLKGAIFE